MPSYDAKTVTQQALDANDPRIIEAAQILAKGLVERETGGVAFAIGVLINALEDVMIDVLHAETPMPENNIQGIEKLLDSLKAHVMHHASCARKINNVEKKPVVH